MGESGFDGSLSHIDALVLGQGDGWNLDKGLLTSDPTRRGSCAVTQKTGNVKMRGLTSTVSAGKNPVSFGLVLLAGNDKHHLPLGSSTARAQRLLAVPGSNGLETITQWLSGETVAGLRWASAQMQQNCFAQERGIWDF